MSEVEDSVSLENANKKTPSKQTPKLAHLIQYHPLVSESQLIFKLDPTSTIQNIPNQLLEPVNEIEATPNLLNISIQVFKSILFILDPKLEASTSLSGFLLYDIRSRTLKTLNVLLKHPPNALLFLNNFSRDCVPLLIELVKAFSNLFQFFIFLF